MTAEEFIIKLKTSGYLANLPKEDEHTIQNLIPKGCPDNDIRKYADPNKIEYNTTEYWDNIKGYVPAKGTIIIYSDYKTELIDGKIAYIPAMKVGTGNAYVQDLQFLSEGDSDLLLNHINNTSIHVTEQEKRFWNRKLNVVSSVSDETLIFNRE